MRMDMRPSKEISERSEGASERDLREIWERSETDL